jgi:hypothetical protein
MRKTTVPAPATPTMQCQVVDVTPALAQKWLGQNTHNRNIRDRAVLTYARDMEAGRWAQNGEAIKFAADGTLLDGQHRLHAVTLAGVTVQLLVITGLQNATQETMDAGSRRSTADALGLRGEANASVLASIAKRVWLWDSGDYKFSGGTVPTTAECADLVQERPDLRRSAEIAVRVHQSFRYLPQSIVGTAHHIFTRIDGNEAVWFFQRLADGAELPAGHPILTLRTRAMTEAADRRRTPGDRHMAYLIRAWNAVREGRTLARIQQDPEAPMPMPK